MTKTRLLASFVSLIVVLCVVTARISVPTVFALNEPTEPLTAETFDELNPLKQFSDSATAEELSTPAGIMSRVLLFAFPIAGLILFVMLIWGGFEMLAGSATKKSLDSGRQRATAAIIGFLLLFVSYWIVRLLEAVFGVTIVS